MRNDRGKAHVGVLVLVVLVATIAAVGLSFWMSVNRIGELSTQLGNQYKEYEQFVFKEFIFNEYKIKYRGQYGIKCGRLCDT